MSLDVEILTALRAAGDGAVSGADLSRRLRVSRAAIWARIEDLRSLGYDIEASPHRGYRLLSTPDVLHADDLISRLGKTDVIGRDIRVFQETTSTNDVIEKLARDGVKEGVVVFAESQTRGRGRLGRKWTSPPRRGLWFSVLLRPDLRPQEATRLTIASATAVRRAIESQTRLKAEIKWPNDILIRGRKVAGILMELSAEVDHVNHVALGIGVDVNLNPGDLPPELRKLATSLKAELERPVSRPELAVAILRELDRDYAQVASSRFAALADEWEAHGITIGHRVVIRVGDRQIRGRAESLGEDGELLLRTDHGHLERIVGRRSHDGKMILLLDIGNTNSHLGLANSLRVVKQCNLPTAAWLGSTAPGLVARFARGAQVEGAALCSVVPSVAPLVSDAVERLWHLPCLELTPKTLRGVGIDYPRPRTIGADRLANAVAAQHRFGSPVVVVDFGTAVTFDVVDRAQNYVGGIIAPGLAAMTDYLHEKTALLPRIKIREVASPIGKSTEQAMLVGAVHGYRGLIRELIRELKRALQARRLPVVATGGYAHLIASKLPEITCVDPLLTLEGLRLVWQAQQPIHTAQRA